jgi:acetoacetyl-CoA synthetase
VLIACDGVRYAGRDIDRGSVVAELRAALPTVEHLIVQCNIGVPVSSMIEMTPDVLFEQVTARDDAKVRAFEPVWLPFDQPLWIVYSSGTTGLPKPIVHGHGGTVIVALALKILHNDVGCSYHPNSWASATTGTARRAG